MKLSIKILSTLLFFSLLTACNLSIENNNGEKKSVSEHSTKEINKNEKKKNDPNNTNKEKEESTSRKETTDLEFEVEGEKHSVSSKLAISELGYSLYVMEDFKFESNGVNKDILFHQEYVEYFVEIEKLSDDIDIEQTKIEIEKIYEGIIYDLNPSDLANEFFHDSKFYLVAETGDLSLPQGQTSIIYLLKEIDGIYYKFTFNFPLKDVAEGIIPPFWSMVSTIKN